VLTHGEPGTVLGVFLIAATIAGAYAVRPEAVRLIIPVPALAYSGAAVIAGLIHDRATGTSHTALAIGAVQWVASGFLAMSTATVLAIAITAARRRPAPQRPRPNGRRQAARPSSDPDPPPGRGVATDGRLTFSHGDQGPYGSWAFPVSGNAAKVVGYQVDGVSADNIAYIRLNSGGTAGLYSRSRGLGADDMLVTSAGLWIASDNLDNSNHCGNASGLAGICFLAYG
jgi:hypothetical protein